MANFDLHTNFGYSAIVTAPSPATSGTSLTVTAGDGTKFPTPPFNAVIWPNNTLPTISNAEIIRVTGKATDTFTITRAQESSIAQAVTTGYQIANSPTLKWWSDIETVASSGKEHNFLVAASNASAAVKLAADYVCTGSNDESKINAAIAALPQGIGDVSGVGGCVQLSSGTFTIANPINIQGSNIKLRGMTSGSTLITVVNSFNNSIIKADGGTGVIFNDTIESIAFEGNSSNQTSGNGISLNNVVETQIRYTTMKNIFNTCLVTTVTNAQDLYNVHVHHNKWGGNVGAYVLETNGETNVYSDNYFFGAKGYSGGAYAMLVTGATIINNQMGGAQNSNLNAYIRTGNTNPISIIGNNINNYSKQAIQLLGGGHSVIGNKIYGDQLAATTYNAIEVWDSGNIIMGNDFGKSSGGFTDNSLADIVEKNSAAVDTVNGNIIVGNNVVNGITVLNPYTKVYGNIGASDRPHVGVAINSTNTATAAQVATGYITSTSAAATSITLPTGSSLGTYLRAVQGTTLDLYIDNTAGSNTVTIVVNTNAILSALAAAEAGGSGLLTVPSGVTGLACFRLVFSSATAYAFSRVS